MSAIPKPRPRLLDKRQVKADTAKVDREENAKVKARSGGLCEVRIHAGTMPARNEVGGKLVGWPYFSSCHRRAGHVHHLISGIGRRNVGKSIKAAHKLHVCELHHEEIHGHVLKPTNDAERYDAATVRYERIT